MHILCVCVCLCVFVCIRLMLTRRMERELRDLSKGIYSKVCVANVLLMCCSCVFNVFLMCRELGDLARVSTPRSLSLSLSL